MGCMELVRSPVNICSIKYFKIPKTNFAPENMVKCVFQLIVTHQISGHCNEKRNKEKKREKRVITVTFFLLLISPQSPWKLPPNHMNQSFILFFFNLEIRRKGKCICWYCSIIYSNLTLWKQTVFPKYLLKTYLWGA